MVFAKEPEDQLVGDLSVPIQEDSLDFVSSPLLILSLDGVFQLKTWEPETRI